MNRIFLLYLCLTLLLSSPLVMNAGVGDEVLVIVPSGKCEEAMHATVSPIRFYHRFAEGYLAGTMRTALPQLRKQGIDFIIIDEHPWSDNYAVVAQHPGAKQTRSLAGSGLQVLYSSGDIQLVKGSEESLARVGELGFTLFRIGCVEIPIETTQLHFPLNFLQQVRDTVVGIIGRVSDSTVNSSIQRMQNFGTRYWSNANRDSVSRWVRNRYSELGMTDVRLDSFQYSSTWQSNVVATLPGAVNPSAELIVGGHHDSYSSNLSQAPGADDNASGTVAALEMARVLRLVNYQPAYTMRFMSYAAEEAGLIGSARYATAARQQNRDIRLMQNYDMIANRDQSQTDRDVYLVWYTGSEAFRDLYAAITRAYTTLTPVNTSSYRSGSDSYSFWQQNYKTVFNIERDFSPYYHSPNDLLQYLDIGYAKEIIQAGLALLVTLDQAPPSPPGVVLRDCGNGTSLFVRWDSVAVQDWARYKISVGRRPAVYDTTYTTTTRSALVAGLTEGRRYYVGVSIVDMVGREGIISEQSLIPWSMPVRPAGFTVENLPRAARLFWRKNQEMDLRGYNVYRAVGAAGTFTRLNPATIPDTLYVDSLLAAGTYRYYATAVDSTALESAPSDTLSVVLTTGGEVAVHQPFVFGLSQNYPNPFNPTTRIVYEIGAPGLVELRVYDVLGRVITTLVHAVKSPGVYVAPWDPSGVPSGVYFYALQAGSFTQTRRMLLVK